MLTIWGRITSINVRKAAWAAEELEIPYQRIDAGGAFGLTKTPEYLSMNPNSVVPTLVDGDFTLWESNVVVRYLCAKHSLGNLYPENLQERFNAERWMDWQQTTFSPSGRDAFWQLIRIPGPEQDTKKIEASIASTNILLDRFEDHLSRHAFVAGPKLTMADIPMACEIHRWYGLPIERTPRKHIEAWYEKMSARPASKKVLTYPLS